MKVSPVGASPLGPSIALSPALNTLNLERHRENVLYDIYLTCMYIPVRRGLRSHKAEDRQAGREV